MAAVARAGAVARALGLRARGLLRVLSEACLQGGRWGLREGALAAANEGWQSLGPGVLTLLAGRLLGALARQKSGAAKSLLSSVLDR